MKTINYRINTNTGRMLKDSTAGDIVIQELENNTTTLVFAFDRGLSDKDRLVIYLTNGKRSKPYRLVRVTSNKYSFEVPREMLVRGRLEFSIQHYNEDLTLLAKYSPETYLYITKGLDITNDTLESRPDLFAELFYRIEQLEKKIKD